VGYGRKAQFTHSRTHTNFPHLTKSVKPDIPPNPKTRYNKIITYLTGMVAEMIIRLGGKHAYQFLCAHRTEYKLTRIVDRHTNEVLLIARPDGELHGSIQTINYREVKVQYKDGDGWEDITNENVKDFILSWREIGKFM
jgi:hypothetical protein